LFDTIYKRAEKQIYAKQQQVKSAAEAASVIVAERDKLRAQITKLKTAADEDRADFDAQWRKLAGVIPCVGVDGALL
jgi:uncharacterized coiled-coil DUF342 family protein